MNFGSLYLFWRFKEHPCPSSPHLGFGGHWRFLTEVLHLDLDLNMVTGLSYTQVLNFCSLFWFWRCTEPPCPLSLDLGLWRMLEVPDWGLAHWSWFVYGQWSWLGYVQEPCLDLLGIFHLQRLRKYVVSGFWWVQDGFMVGFGWVRGSGSAKDKD